jgi:hypothetical protein
MHGSIRRLWPALALLCVPAAALAADDDKPEKKPDFPPFAEVAKDFEKVVSTAEGQTYYGIWKREKDGQMLAELPAGFASQKQFIATTMPTGELFAGLQGSDFYVYWKRFDKRMALIQPNMAVRSSGDQASKDSIANHFVDRVLLDVPIVCMGPGGQPVIDLDELLLGNLKVFYGASVNQRLARIAKAKAFPKNIEIAYEVPAGASSGGRRGGSPEGALKTFHFSISEIPSNPSYEPRAADERVGYFQTDFRDLGKFRDDQVTQRYINRWQLQKADPKLKLSPPREPITFYLEHTVPVRYRRFVKEGVLAWNKAFEKVGISDAIVVHFQDKASGAHMDKDPEDVRYNFIRWLSNDIGTAIGPSRAHPETGQILDADVVLTDGWIRHFWNQANEFLPQTAMEGMGPETLRWLDRHPAWDPRVRLAAPERQDLLVAEARQRALLQDRGYELAYGDGTVLSHPELVDLAASLPGDAALCMASVGKAQDMALAGLSLELLGLVTENEEDAGDSIDGIPEWFIGPVLSELVSHEVGHTLGLRHNFKASSIYSLAAINSADFKGQKPFAGSVMDYLPINVVLGEDGKLQGDIDMIGIGPYDEWAIQYGYGFGDLDEVLARVAEPELAYGTDEDTYGPDPLARRYDFAADPLDFAGSRMRIVEMAREKLLSDFVKEGDSWGRARHGYETTLSTQNSMLTMMANWLGGSFVHRNRKGDPDAQDPLQAVPAEQQRAALRFVLDNAFRDEAFGLTPAVLSKLSVQKWSDSDDAGRDATYPVHDRVAGIQSGVMTLLLYPSRLRRLYDSELCTPAEGDAMTLPELLDTISGEVWKEIGFGGMTARPVAASFSGTRAFSVRSPAISSLRRNLQREHLERLIDLSLEEGTSASTRSIALLARSTLEGIGRALEGCDLAALDPYSRAHLADAAKRIEKALDAGYTRNAMDAASGGGFVIHIGRDETER